MLDSSTLILIVVVVVAFGLPTIIRAVGRPLNLPLPFGLDSFRLRRVQLEPEAQAAFDLLEQAKRNQARFETSRTRLEVRGQAYRAGRRQRIELLRDGRFAYGAVQIDTTSIGNPDRPGRYEETIINKEGTFYRHIDGHWTTSKIDRYPPTTGGNAADPGMLADRVRRADTVRDLGQATIEGIECRVFSYSISPTIADPRRDLASLEPHLPTKGRLLCDRCDGQFAVGIDDLIVHQHIQQLAAHTSTEPKDNCEITHTYTVWDLNSPDITVSAPKGIAAAR